MHCRCSDTLALALALALAVEVHVPKYPYIDLESIRKDRYSQANL